MKNRLSVEPLERNTAFAIFDVEGNSFLALYSQSLVVVGGEFVAEDSPEQ